MKRFVFSAVLLAGGIAIGLGLPESIRAQVPGYVTKQVFKTDLINLPGQEAIIMHRSGPRVFDCRYTSMRRATNLFYVIEGEQTFEIDGVGTKVVRAGEVVYTPPNTAHFGRNATDKLSKTLVIRIKAKDKPVMTEVK